MWAGTIVKHVPDPLHSQSDSYDSDQLDGELSINDHNVALFDKT